jgi:hypothetical protein
MSFRKVHILLVASLLLPGIAACGDVATPTNSVTVLPKDCRMLVNEQMPMTLDGLVPPNAVITWSVDGGSIISAPPGLNALFVAPPQPAIVTVSISISSGTPSLEIPITRQCIVTSNDAPVLQPVEPSPVAQVASSDPVVINTQPTVIISEVMANPCGGLEVKKWNEYVELYNYGDQPVDVSGWWLADLGDSGTPDELVAWSTRNPMKPLNGNLVLNSTVIPARGFAVILSPLYTEGMDSYRMPYNFPAGTVILTAAHSASLGDDYFNIIGDGEGRDVLVLYKGGPSVIKEVISTYGTPKLDPYVTGLRDDYLDNLPLNLHECSSVERVMPTGSDSFENWREISGSPGEAPY